MTTIFRVPDDLLQGEHGHIYIFFRLRRVPSKMKGRTRNNDEWWSLPQVPGKKQPYPQEGKINHIIPKKKIYILLETKRSQGAKKKRNYNTHTIVSKRFVQKEWEKWKNAVEWMGVYALDARTIKWPSMLVSTCTTKNGWESKKISTCDWKLMNVINMRIWKALHGGPSK